MRLPNLIAMHRLATFEIRLGLDRWVVFMTNGNRMRLPNLIAMHRLATFKIRLGLRVKRNG